MAEFVKVTEQESLYHGLEKMPVGELLRYMNLEDQQVPVAVSKVIPQIEQLVTALVDKILAGGRLFYLGAGTSGRLGILDASEIPPTYGLPQGIVVGLIAGGEQAIRVPVENAEDNLMQGWEDLTAFGISAKDFVIGIAASGTTPYVIGALQQCREKRISTGSISCNPGSPLSSVADFPIEVVVGPEFVTGSTRLKSGTAQKLVLNMISTSTMVRIGRVEDNKMVNMQLSNEKLVDRGTRMVMEELNITDYNTANQLLLQHGSVKKAVDANKTGS
jgi:N-acetylmuramic acid 6-phosphate etherase